MRFVPAALAAIVLVSPVMGFTTPFSTTAVSSSLPSTTSLSADASLQSDYLVKAHEDKLRAIAEVEKKKNVEIQVCACLHRWIWLWTSESHSDCYLYICRYSCFSLFLTKVLFRFVFILNHYILYLPNSPKPGLEEGTGRSKASFRFLIVGDCGYANRPCFRCQVVRFDKGGIDSKIDFLSTIHGQLHCGITSSKN